MSSESENEMDNGMEEDVESEMDDAEVQEPLTRYRTSRFPLAAKSLSRRTLEAWSQRRAETKTTVDQQQGTFPTCLLDCRHRLLAGRAQRKVRRNVPRLAVGRTTRLHQRSSARCGNGIARQRGRSAGRQ